MAEYDLQEENEAARARALEWLGKNLADMARTMGLKLEAEEASKRIAEILNDCPKLEA